MRDPQGRSGGPDDFLQRRLLAEPAGFQSLLLASVRESIIASDLQGTVIYWGQGAERLYGYSAEEMVGQSIERILRPGERKIERDARLQQVLATGVWSGQYQQRRRDGSDFWADTVISLIRDEHGQPAGFIGIDRDITDRKRTEEQLQTRTQQLQAITDNAPDLIARLDHNLRHLFVSRAFSQATGIRAAEYLGRTSEELGMSAAFCSRWNQCLRQVLETGRAVEMEFELDTTDPPRYFHALAAPETRRDQAVDTVVVIARDVTAHREADQHLKEVEDRFRAFMQHSPTICFIKDASRRYVYGNKAMRQMLPADRRDILGRDDVELYGEQVAAQLRANDDAILAAGRSLELLESVPTGTGLRHYLVVKFPLDDSSGAHYVGGIAIDLTERRQAEEELQQHQATLAHVTRLSMMGEMVAGIAHEIAQPLSAIANFAAASRKTLADPQGDPQKIGHWVELINQQASRAGEIIDRLRRFVRGSEPQRSTYLLNDLIHDSIKLINAEVKRQTVTLRVELHTPSPRVWADGVQIQQVMINLLRNACEAMQETPLMQRQIHISSRVQEGQVEVCVRDAGVGLPEPDADRVLDAFFSTKPQGMGMGLAVSRRIVDAHGGRLWATSAPEDGTIFHFTLPTYREEQA